MDENVGLQRQLVAQAREAGVLDERARMAREIHDTIAQGLTGIVTQLEAAEQASDRPDDWRRHVDNAAPAGPREPVRGASVGRGVATRGPRGRDARGRRWPTSPSAGRRSTASRSSSRRPATRAAPSRDRGGPAAHGPGGAGQRRQARRRHAGRRDAVVHGRCGRPSTCATTASASRCPMPSGGRGVRLRADGHAPAGRPRRGHARGRVRAGRRHRDLRARPGDRRPAGRVPARDRHPAADRRRPPGGARRAARDVRRRPGVRGRSARRPTAPRRSTLAEALRPDVVLMDLRMPGDRRRDARSGELAERGNPARVLVLTTYDTDADVVPAHRGGRDGLPAQGRAARRSSSARSARPHRGESVLAPSVATRLVSQFRRPAPGHAERARAGGPVADRPGRDEPGRRGAAVHLRGDGQDAPPAHLRQARRQRSCGRGGDGLRARAARAEPGLTRPPGAPTTVSGPATTRRLGGVGGSPSRREPRSDRLTAGAEPPVRPGRLDAARTIHRPQVMRRVCARE